jgi:acyl carrier protein
MERTILDRVEQTVRSFLDSVGDGEAVPLLVPLRELGLDSLTSIELVLALEDEFDLEVPDDLLGRELFDSLAGLAAVIARLTEARNLS